VNAPLRSLRLVATEGLKGRTGYGSVIAPPRRGGQCRIGTNARLHSGNIDVVDDLAGLYRIGARVREHRVMERRSLRLSCRLWQHGFQLRFLCDCGLEGGRDTLLDQQLASVGRVFEKIGRINRCRPVVPDRNRTCLARTETTAAVVRLRKLAADTDTEKIKRRSARILKRHQRTWASVERPSTSRCLLTDNLYRVRGEKQHGALDTEKGLRQMVGSHLRDHHRGAIRTEAPSDWVAGHRTNRQRAVRSYCVRSQGHAAGNCSGLVLNAGSIEVSCAVKSHIR
jgi:hypothetical protein